MNHEHHKDCPKPEMAYAPCCCDELETPKTPSPVTEEEVEAAARVIVTTIDDDPCCTDELWPIVARAALEAARKVRNG